jgi:hypothetical protein
MSRPILHYQFNNAVNNEQANHHNHYFFRNSFHRLLRNKLARRKQGNFLHKKEANPSNQI